MVRERGEKEKGEGREISVRKWGDRVYEMRVGEV